MLRVGTDCSGIEAPVQALKNINVNFTHVFSSDVDKFVRKSIVANYNPEILYEDILTRDHSELPDVDLYVAGVPCQPYSRMGKLKGLNDPRSNVMYAVIDTIKLKLPTIVVLENVKSFHKSDAYKILISEIESLNYKIHVDMLKTTDYGLPQTRSRLFIICILDDKYSYSTPLHVPMIPLDDLILDKTICTRNVSGQMQRNLLGVPDGYIVSNGGYKAIAFNKCPTLLTTCNYYHTTYNRYLTVDELLLLQGFKSFQKCVSNTQLKRQIGNSISVPVLEAIFTRLYTV